MIIDQPLVLRLMSDRQQNVELRAIRTMFGTVVPCSRILFMWLFCRIFVVMASIRPPEVAR